MADSADNEGPKSTWEDFKEFDLSDFKDPTWHSILLKHEPFLKKMAGELRESYDKFDGYFDIYPPVPYVFNALRLVPFEKVKCVIFGQGKIRLYLSIIINNN